MKQQISKIIVFTMMITMISFISCQKESDFESLNTTDIAQAKYDIEVLHYTNSKAQNISILSFVDEETLDNTIKDLKQRKDDHETDFYNEYKSLDIEAYNNKIEETSFDEYAPLKDFNSQYSHRSLLNNYIQAENEWLQQEDLPDETDPENLFNGLDQYELSVVNTDYAVKIGNVILVFVKGGTVEITDADFSTIKKVVDYKDIRDINEKDFKNVKLYPSEMSQQTDEKYLCWGDDCDIYEYNSSDWTYKYKRKMKYSNKYYRVYWGHWKLKFYAKTRAYKKTWIGWKKNQVSTIKAGLRGYFDYYYDGSTGTNPCNCGDGEFYFGNWANKSKNNSKEAFYEKVITFYGTGDSVHWSIHDWWVYSDHYIYDSGSRSKTLYTNQ